MTTARERGVFDMLRLSTIRRWGIVEMVRDQSVAEHVYRVWVLAQDLYRIMEDTPHNSFEQRDTEFWALTHDMEEVYTGDLPSTVKVILEKLHPGINKMLKEEILSTYFPSLVGRMRGVDKTLAAYYVKIADIVESILYLRQYAMDPNHALQVESTLLSSLELILQEGSKAYKSVAWQRAEDWARDLLCPVPATPVPYSRLV